MSWFSGFEPIVLADVPLREFTWYRLGGPARWFCEPRDESELSTLLARLHTAQVPWRVLGGGSNVIVRDEGFDGAVIHLRGPAFERIEFDENDVYVAAGAGHGRAGPAQGGPQRPVPLRQRQKVQKVLHGQSRHR